MSQASRIFSCAQQLISLPSVSCSNPRYDMGNRAVIDQLAEWLEPMGFQCEIMPLPLQPHKANLIATFGSGPGGLVLAGHTDTVPFDEGRWQSDPFKLTEIDERWHGLGTTDMKTFLVLAIEAARAFLNQPLQQPLIILATADEETGMEGARALVQAGRPAARYAVIGEPTGLKPVRSHKGIFMERIRVLGKAGHSSNPALGHNAIDGMHNVLQGLYAYRQQLSRRTPDASFTVSHSTLNIGCIHGGDNPNRIPAACELDVDLRFLPTQQLNELREELRETVRKSLQDSSFLVEFDPLFSGIPAFSTLANSPLVQACEQLTQHQATAVDFATEGSLFNQLGMQTVVMGPGSIDCAHQPDEYIETGQLLPTVKLLESLIAKFCL